MRRKHKTYGVSVPDRNGPSERRSHYNRRCSGGAELVPPQACLLAEGALRDSQSHATSRIGSVAAPMKKTSALDTNTLLFRFHCVVGPSAVIRERYPKS